MDLLRQRQVIPTEPRQLPDRHQACSDADGQEMPLRISLQRPARRGHLLGCRTVREIYRDLHPFVQCAA